MAESTKALSYVAIVTFQATGLPEPVVELALTTMLQPLPFRPQISAMCSGLMPL